MLLIGGAITEKYSDEELATLEELKNAGLLESDIQQLIEEYEATYNGEDYDYNLDEDEEDIDEASDRGGPRWKRRRPGAGKRKGQRLK